jgi:hypothetical protein
LGLIIFRREEKRSDMVRSRGEEVRDEGRQKKSGVEETSGYERGEEKK